MTTGEIIETQNTIIATQSRIITELAKELEMYITVAEYENLPVVEMINEVAAMRSKVE